MIPGSANPLLLTSADSGYEIERSLRFNDADQSNLSRTPSAAGNRKTFTWNAWTKRSELGGTQRLMFVGPGSNYFSISFNNDQIQVEEAGGSNSFYVYTNAVFRDPSSWYHVVITVDTTQATQTNRVKVYVNGTEQPLTAGNNWPPQNADLQINNTVDHRIGRNDADCFNGFLADVHFIDGQALAPTDFGETNTDNLWVPKAYAGTYGTNGFRLEFADNSSNAALGTDTSGNSNTWTVNNLTASAPGLATANQGMDVVTWTGNSADRDIGGLAFQPDFVWIKKRNSSSYGDHMLYDVVRGATKVLRSDNTAAEITDASTLDAFNSDGFSIGGGWEVNKSGDTYVSWAWKAGGAASSNTDGTITSSVSANNTYGFSIVSFTDGGSACTLGHGLSSAPKMIWAKFRGASGNWSVYHEATGNDHRLKLNLADAKQSGNDWWNATSPTSSVFSLGSNLVASTTQIAYCWSEVVGFSKFGSYTGGTNPKTITTGFKPAFLLIKRIDGSNQWVVIDSKRGGTKKLSPNLTVIENDGTYLGGDSANTVEFLSDGFKLTSTNAETNGSGQTHIYAAYASKPSGEGIDSLFDTPINGDTASDTGAGGEITGCYATFNPLDKTSGITLSDGNLKATGQANGSDRVRGTIAMPRSGKWYFEFTLGSAFYGYIGISNIDGTKLVGRNEDGRKYTEAGHVSTPFASITAGDIVGVALDNNTTLTFYKNGVAESTTVTVDSNTDYFAMANFYNAIYILNSGQRAFAYPLSGYKSLNTANLSSTIADGSQYFDTKVWTGDGTGSRSFTGYAFSPDFAWVKTRNVGYDHVLWDVVRGAGVSKELVSNDSRVEGGASTNAYGYLSAFNSDGFSSTAGSSDNDYFNKSGTTYVGWAWDAGTGANPVGDIWQGSATKYIGVKFASASGGTVSYGQSSGSTTVEVWTSSNNSSWTQQGGTQTLSTGHTLTTSDQYVFIRNTSDATFTNWYAAATNGADGHYSSQTYPSGASWSGPSYTDYDWRADGGTLNNDGDILSIVRAQPSAGFSIVSYTGIGGIPKSIGHGLNSAPGLVIVKRRDAADDWPTYFISHTTFFLNTTANTVNNDQYHHGDYKPTSTLFTVGGNGAINANGGTYIAYCFASVEGYSKISNFQGNGSTDGTFVYTGFKPRFLLIKRYGVKAWQIIDTARSPFNVTDDRLFPSDSGAESSGSNFNLDILSNGFKCRTAHDSTNAASTYAYYAVAEHPFASNGGLAR